MRWYAYLMQDPNFNERIPLSVSGHSNTLIGEPSPGLDSGCLTAEHRCLRWRLVFFEHGTLKDAEKFWYFCLLHSGRAVLLLSPIARLLALSLRARRS